MKRFETLTVFKIRRDTSKLWKLNNPILEEHEPALETDTLKLRIGDGKTEYKDLPYYLPFEKDD